MCDGNYELDLIPQTRLIHNSKIVSNTLNTGPNNLGSRCSRRREEADVCAIHHGNPPPHVGGYHYPCAVLLFYGISQTCAWLFQFKGTVPLAVGLPTRTGRMCPNVQRAPVGVIHAGQVS